jgi:hypothetical protein
MPSDLKFQLFPRSCGMNESLQSVIDCFDIHINQISSSQHQLSSNEVLEIIRNSLENKQFICETGKTKDKKISIPVLFGYNNKIDKSFNADALSRDGKIVIEVEAGRAVDNNQFLKDIFQACMMLDVLYLVIAVRNDYRGSNDFMKVYMFLETLYVSNRLHLPLKGILLIGY